MEPNRIGRVLGITTRLAAGKIREQAAKVGQPTGPGAAAGVRATGVDASATRTRMAGMGQSAGQAVADGGRRWMRGAGRFGSAMVKPVARAGSILVLQVTGLFFGIFAVFFLSHTLRTWRATRWHGRHAAVYLGLGLLFTWFTASSFWRAKRKQRG